VIELWSPPSDPIRGASSLRAVSDASASAAGADPILVVDDDPSILAMVVQILRNEGLPVVSASNGLEAGRDRTGLAFTDPARYAHAADGRLGVREGDPPSRGALPDRGDDRRRQRPPLGRRNRCRRILTKPFQFLELLAIVEQYRRGLPN
jgi:hypothetical protein